MNRIELLLPFCGGSEKTCYLGTDSVYNKFVGYNLKVSHCCQVWKSVS